MCSLFVLSTHLPARSSDWRRDRILVLEREKYFLVIFVDDEEIIFFVHFIKCCYYENCRRIESDGGNGNDGCVVFKKCSECA